LHAAFQHAAAIFALHLFLCKAAAFRAAPCDEKGDFQPLVLSSQQLKLPTEFHPLSNFSQWHACIRNVQLDHGVDG